MIHQQNEGDKMITIRKSETADTRPNRCQVCERPRDAHTATRFQLPKARVQGFDRLFRKLTVIILEDK